MASVFPGTSHNMEMSVVSRNVHGGAMSSMSKDEEESYRNRMTLEEARWTGVRKKIPGMSGVPKKRTSKQVLDNTDDVDPFKQRQDNMVVFIRQHFKQKECAKFVPKPGQTTGPKAVKKRKDLKCHCGEVLMEHAGVKNVSTPGLNTFMMEYLLGSSELKKLMAQERFNDPPPDKLPGDVWKADSETIRSTDTCTFGKINFENVEHAGGKKPAKYIRMTDDGSVENLITLMTDYWRIMEPERPNLVISVVGGAKNFKLDGRMRDTFSSGLIKAAKTTSAWLISSGFNMGVMKAVGQAVRQGQSFCWDNDRMAHVLRCISIAPWGYVKNRKVLESLDCKGKFNANYRTSNVILHDSAVPLNPDHTHFIFVDDGHRIRYGGVSGVRARLEQKIQLPPAEGGLGIPVVLVVVEGGTDCINDARTSIEHKIPVVVCAGTGRAADILAYAYKHTKSSGGERNMKERHLHKLMDRICDAYGKNWKEEIKITKTQEIADSVQICCENPDLMTVFHMNKHEDLDLAILSVLLKAKKGADEAQRLSQLKLALTWDRVDIAQEEIFREDVLWSTGSLDEILTEALIKDKCKFVELMLQQGVVMKEYLTVGNLEKLYKEVPKHNYLHNLVKKITGKDELNLESVRLLLLHLLDRYDRPEEQFLTVGIEMADTDLKDPKQQRFKRPYKMLLVWALLMNRQVMAKLFWELGEEPISSALAATRIYHSMAKNLPRHESNFKDKIIECEKEFELLATHVLDECHHKDPDKAMMIVERKSPCWNGMTCLQIAAAATDQVFLSSNTCYASITTTWRHGIIAPWLKILFAVLFPPYILFGIEILKMGEQKLTSFQKFGAFYSSPMSKFAHGMLMYLIFLVLHSYMVLVDFMPGYVTPLEYITIIWIISFFVDELHTFIAFPSPTIRSKVRDWYGVLNWMDVFNFILAMIGFIIHLAAPEHYTTTKVLYSINSIIFFVRIMKLYITNGQLGPKIFMIQKMFDELRMFIMLLVVFLLAYGVSSQGLLYHSRSPSWSIIKDVLYFPYWQLYGEIFLDDIETDNCTAESLDCRTFHWLVPFLLAAYLLVGNILLLNLLIAIFSHVFDTVEKHCNEIWKYQMYFLVMEYENKTAVPPPFSLFQHAFLAVRWIIRKTCLKKHRNKQTFSRRHLDYLQLYEKEMMMNYLRHLKAQQMSGIETTVHNLQKRVDELTKLIEDEVIADQQPMGLTYGMDTIVSRPGTAVWPGLDRVINLAAGDMDKAQPDPEPEAPVKPKKHKKHKKHKKESEEENSENVVETKLNNINLPHNISTLEMKPDLPDKEIRRNSETNFLPPPTITTFDESGTDNSSPIPKLKFGDMKKFTGEDSSIPLSPRTSSSWTPKRQQQNLFQDENELKPKPSLVQRRSMEKMRRYVSSDDSEEERASKFKNLKKKKKKTRKQIGSESD